MAPPQSNGRPTLWQVITSIALPIIAAIVGYMVHRLDQHEMLPGHPVIVERVQRYEQTASERYSGIITRLDKLSDQIEKMER